MTRAQDELEHCLRQLASGKYTDAYSGMNLLLHIDRPYEVTRDGLVFNPGTKQRVFIPVRRAFERRRLAELVERYKGLGDHDRKSAVKHRFTEFLDDRKKSNLGKYFTPAHLVETVHSLVRPYLKHDSIVLDPAAGCGAFLEPFSDHKVIGADIDPSLVHLLSALGFKGMRCDNSLLNVSRRKYGLSSSDHLAVVGNPPYNDVTSRNKKFGKKAKDKIEIHTDPDLACRDYGLSFLRALNKLKADVIGMLHPLSFLIKESNFRRLTAGPEEASLFSEDRPFAENYTLKKGIIFSSAEFSDTSRTPFPILAALYLRSDTGMTYEDVRRFSFDILNEDTKFCLETIETIDDGGFIRKYPPAGPDKNKRSDMGLYMYNFRDINSLLSGANLTEKEDFEAHVTIHENTFYQYAYLNSFKRYFEKDFRFGNLSPIVERRALESDEALRDAFVIDTILSNQRFAVFDFKNPRSWVRRKKVSEAFRRKRDHFRKSGPNVYAWFFEGAALEPVSSPRALKEFLREYFCSLKRKMLA